MRDGLTATRRLVYAVGQRNVRYAITTFTGLWKNSEKNLYPKTLRSHACGMVLPRPSARLYAVGSVMFITPRHDITDLWKNSEQTSVSTDLRSDACGGLTATRPPVCGGSNVRYARHDITACEEFRTEICIHRP
ncbi:hypothetical protein TNCT_163741, partial [Trichonephila clavata]